jgi:hypothetical protein
MQVPSYSWSSRSGVIAVALTVAAVVAYSLLRDDLNGGFMIGYLTAMAVTAVEVLRTRHSTKWNWLLFLSAAGTLVLVALATTGAFRLYHLVMG